MHNVIILLSIFAILLFGCSPPKVDYDRLIALDEQAQDLGNLTKISRIARTTRWLNDLKVCDGKCYGNKPHYKEVLEKMDIPTDVFDRLTSEMDALGFIGYKSHLDYSLWIQGGALGGMHGLIINHGSPTNGIPPFRLVGQDLSL